MTASQLILTAFEDLERVCCSEGSLLIRGLLNVSRDNCMFCMLCLWEEAWLKLIEKCNKNVWVYP